MQATIVSPSNILTFSHGRGWQSAHPNSHKNEGDFQSHTVESLIPLAKIVEHDLSQIKKLKSEIISEFEKHFLDTLYATIEEATNFNEKSNSAIECDDYLEGIIEALQKVEFGFDRDGRIALPQLHVSSEMRDRIAKELVKKGPDFHNRVNEIIAVKSAAAKAREAERLSKFPQKREPL